MENKNFKNFQKNNFEEIPKEPKALIESTVDLQFVSMTKQNKDEISFLKSQIASLKNQMNDSIDETLQNSFAQVTNEFESFIRKCSNDFRSFLNLEPKVTFNKYLGYSKK